MTGAFVFGPLLALVGFVMGVRFQRARQQKSRPRTEDGPSLPK